MAVVGAVVLLSVITVAQSTTASEDYWYPTDQSRLDQLDEVNSFVQFYSEHLNDEVNTYEKLGVVDKELRPYFDAATVVRKLVQQSWLRNMKPDDRYSVPSEKLDRQKAIDDLTEEIAQIDRTTPVADAILLYNKVDKVSLLNDRKEVILFGIKSLEESIKKAEQVEDFDKADTLNMWKSKLSNQLESIENDIKQATVLKQMILQSYILNFNPPRDEKNVKIKHSNGLIEDEREFTVPPLNTLSVLQEINGNFK